MTEDVRHPSEVPEETEPWSLLPERGLLSRLGLCEEERAGSIRDLGEAAGRGGECGPGGRGADGAEGRGREREAHPPFSESLPKSPPEPRSAGTPAVPRSEPQGGTLALGRFREDPSPS